jgi:hypothetical protein
MCVIVRDLSGRQPVPTASPPPARVCWGGEWVLVDLCDHQIGGHRSLVVLIVRRVLRWEHCSRTSPAKSNRCSKLIGTNAIGAARKPLGAFRPSGRVLGQSPTPAPTARKSMRCSILIPMPASSSPPHRVERHDTQHDTGTAATRRRVAGTGAAVEGAGGADRGRSGAADRGAHPAPGRIARKLAEGGSLIPAGM